MSMNTKTIAIASLICAAFFLIDIAVGDDLIVRVPQNEGNVDTRSLYFIDLLKLALDKTITKYGPYRLVMADLKMQQDRALNWIEQEKIIDLYWSMTDKNRETKLLPVRIPLMKGLLGYRIFIINKDDQEKFDRINTIGDLKKLTAGQGHDWPDVDILQANNLNVVSFSNYEGSFKMLKARRFDYYPRGVGEIFPEIEARKEMGLTVEKHLLLRYPAPIFYFVNRKNLPLAARIEEGLRMAISDGSFNRLFFNHPNNKAIFSKAGINERLIFDMVNPNLTLETQALLQDKSLWLDPRELKDN